MSDNAFAAHVMYSGLPLPDGLSGMTAPQLEVRAYDDARRIAAEVLRLDCDDAEAIRRAARRRALVSRAVTATAAVYGVAWYAMLGGCATISSHSMRHHAQLLDIARALLDGNRDALAMLRDASIILPWRRIAHELPMIWCMTHAARFAMLARHVAAANEAAQRLLSLVPGTLDRGLVYTARGELVHALPERTRGWMLAQSRLCMPRLEP